MGGFQYIWHGHLSLFCIPFTADFLPNTIDQFFLTHFRSSVKECNQSIQREFPSSKKWVWSGFKQHCRTIYGNCGKCCWRSLTSEMEMWGCWNAPLMGQTHRHQLLQNKGSWSTLFGVLKVEGSRNPLASRQLSIPSFVCQRSFVFSPSGRQTSWQKIRQVQWEPAWFPAHLPQNRPLSCGISTLSEIQQEYAHLELLQPALQLNPD